VTVTVTVTVIVSVTVTVTVTVTVIVTVTYEPSSPLAYQQSSSLLPRQPLSDQADTVSLSHS
jgi:hypothetical protein